ncbi:TetR/AcrR family transcriptional regulator [Caballeronia sp. Sq4a]|uniref:TetR/AcrR family transcriptional regulator n=1 Tax=Caballeronia sp. Sq4a TaxID=2878152 RepID=UPI0020C1682B|nr:TetR/AcrR family transcriptional regulator [Caballeronia sp. Sq4a]
MDIDVQPESRSLDAHRIAEGRMKRLASPETEAGSAVVANPAEPAKRRRRKDARPGEIIDVALMCFLEAGYEATRLDDVARRAGVAKGTVYLYFETKEHLFRAVVQQVTATNVRQLSDTIRQFDGAFVEFVPLFLSRVATSIGSSLSPRIAALILKESERFPDLGRIWVEEVVAPMFEALQALVERSQKKGEVREGDSRAHVFSLVGPMFAAILSRQVLAPLGFEPVDLSTLARQHATTVLAGLCPSSPTRASAHGHSGRRGKMAVPETK